MCGLRGNVRSTQVFNSDKPASALVLSTPDAAYRGSRACDMVGTDLANPLSEGNVLWKGARIIRVKNKGLRSRAKCGNGEKKRGKVLEERRYAVFLRG